MLRPSRLQAFSAVARNPPTQVSRPTAVLCASECFQHRLSSILVSHPMHSRAVADEEKQRFLALSTSPRRQVG